MWSLQCSLRLVKAVESGRDHDLVNPVAQHAHVVCAHCRTQNSLVQQASTRQQPATQLRRRQVLASHYVVRNLRLLSLWLQHVEEPQQRLSFVHDHNNGYATGLFDRVNTSNSIMRDMIFSFLVCSLRWERLKASNTARLRVDTIITEVPFVEGGMKSVALLVERTYLILCCTSCAHVYTYVYNCTVGCSSWGMFCLWCILLACSTISDSYVCLLLSLV